ncbi:MAG: DNA endonuclease SmrA [Pseudomonadota bacterium]|nr:DNA endonuclease SmrA [Pseudomonadota bacterium]
MTPDDEDLFAAEMEGVVPLAREPEAAPAPRERTPTETQLARQRAATHEDGDPNPLTLGEVRPVAPFDEIAWKNHGVQEGVWRKLRLGKYPADAVLDLHRKTVREARDEVWRFVEEGVAHGLRCVVILHGRGERSETPGRLKSYVAEWLEALDGVLAFHTAKRQHGGYGAVYVLLRKNDEKRNDNRERFARRRS